MDWIQTVPINDLEKRDKLIFRQGARQIAVMRYNGGVFALDNRCPHEGYPLQEGTIRDCVLTCNWHNWKFDLRTGNNLNGMDNVNVYETKIRDGFVWLRIPQVSREAIQAKILSQMKRAFQDRQYDRIARELARLHFNNLDPMIAIRSAIEWSHDKLEYGMDHAYAVTADWLRISEEIQSIEEKLACLVEAIDFMAESSLRQPAFPYTERILPFSQESFLQAIEQENEETAVAQINGALSAGLHFPDLELWLTTAALQHYNDFGHSLIYVTKIGALIDRLGFGVEKYLLHSLVRSIISAIREDFLPEFRLLPDAIPKWKDVDSQPVASTSGQAYLYGMSVKATLEWVLEQSRVADPRTIYSTLLFSIARHLLHYDTDYQLSYKNSISKNIGWLDFTHGITFSNAVRKQCERFPELWKHGLLQMACFLGRNQSFLDNSVSEQDWFVQDVAGFEEETLHRLIDHGKGLPIYAAHYVKTFLAARQEHYAIEGEGQKYIYAAFNRYLNSPLKEKHVRRTMSQALDLVGRDFRDTD